MSITTIPIPTQTIGPILITGDIETSVQVPLATYESPMWPSTNRGASVSRLAGGIRTTLLGNCMTRSIIVEGPNALYLRNIMNEITIDLLNEVVSKTSRFANLTNTNHQIVGNLLYLRLEMTTGDASGHNMVTKAADAVIHWLTERYTLLRYVSISGNLCVDKKVSAANGLLGRGKYVVAEITIPANVCTTKLKTTPEAIHELNIKKNLTGSIVAGGLRTANAHFANLLYAFYLATGQDVANIVEGSQGMVYTQIQGDELYFSVTLPNIIVGTIGNGKELEFVRKHLEMLGCLNDNEPGANSIRLALITAATVLCGELSLLAAQSNPGELMRAHHRFERGDETYRTPIAEKECD